MSKNRIIGFAAGAIVALGLTSGVASAAGAFSADGASPDGTKSAKSFSSAATEGKDGAKPEGVAVQRTEEGMNVRKLTKEELENMDGFKPAKPLAEDAVVGEGTSDK